jgi:hypothetical protein
LDEDAILPLMGSECVFPDDALASKNWFTSVGEETLTENLNFINECLGTDLDKMVDWKLWDITRVCTKRNLFIVVLFESQSFTSISFACVHAPYGQIQQ